MKINELKKKKKKKRKKDYSYLVGNNTPGLPHCAGLQLHRGSIALHGQASPRRDWWKEGPAQRS